MARTALYNVAHALRSTVPQLHGSVRTENTEVHQSTECFDSDSSLPLKLLVSMPSRQRVAVLKGRSVLHHATRTKRVASCIKGTTETCRSFNCSQSAQRIGPLFDPTVILLQPMSEIGIRPVLSVGAHGLTYGSWRGTMPISCDLIRDMANYRHCLLEKPLSSFPLSFLAQPGSNQMALVVDRSIPISPLARAF